MARIICLCGMSTFCCKINKMCVIITNVENVLNKTELFNLKVLTVEQARQMSALELAFVGDCIYSLFVKNSLVTSPMKVSDLTKKASQKVNAEAQEVAYFLIENELSETEAEIARRARNAHIKTKAKNFSIESYRHATAIEAVFGFLYLTANNERLCYFAKKIGL